MYTIYKYIIAIRQFCYRFTSTYGVSDLSVESMEKVLIKLGQDEEVFNTYYRLNTLGHTEGKCQSSV
jgi:hypothetical protein